MRKTENSGAFGIRLLFLVCLLLGFNTMVLAEEGEVALQHAPLVDASDKPSLQRGAQVFMNYCAGCHSLRYIRYEQLAQGLGLVKPDGKLDEALMKQDLMLGGESIYDTPRASMSSEDAEKWFGVSPPDLSLVVRSRGADWVYTYLLSFYQDAARPWGVNNLVFPTVAMPNVLASLQGVQMPVMHTVMMKDSAGNTYPVEQVERLHLSQSGALSTEQFNALMGDVVNFLAYISEPYKAERLSIGKWVLGFLTIFFVVAYGLKRDYWREIK